MARLGIGLSDRNQFMPMTANSESTIGSGELSSRGQYRILRRVTLDHPSGPVRVPDPAAPEHPIPLRPWVAITRAAASGSTRSHWPPGLPRGLRLSRAKR
jgi:hypothetical protein